MKILDFWVMKIIVNTGLNFQNGKGKCQSERTGLNKLKTLPINRVMLGKTQCIGLKQKKADHS